MQKLIRTTSLGQNLLVLFLVLLKKEGNALHFDTVMLYILTLSRMTKWWTDVFFRGAYF